MQIQEIEKYRELILSNLYLWVNVATLPIETRSSVKRKHGRDFLPAFTAATLNENVFQSKQNFEESIYDVKPELYIENENFAEFSTLFLTSAFSELFQLKTALINIENSQINQLELNSGSFDGYSLIFMNCKIQEISSHTGIDQTHFNKCFLKIFISYDNRLNLRYSYGNTFEYIQLTQKTRRAVLNHSEIFLIQAESTIDLKLSFSQCHFNFNKSVLKHHSLSTSAFDLPSLLNTFENLYFNPDLRSNKFTLNRYIIFFKTRDSLIKKFLFWYSEGYYIIWKPMVGFFSSYSLIVFSTFLLTSKLSDSVWNPIFAPAKIIRDLILKDLSFHNDISIEKIVIVVCIPISIYSLFALLTAVKRRFGFGKLE